MGRTCPVGIPWEGAVCISLDLYLAPMLPHQPILERMTTQSVFMSTFIPLLWPLWKKCFNKERGWGWEWVGGRLKKEGIYAYLQLIHIVVQQKVAQHCKANILPLKKRKRNILVKFTTFHITLAERISIIKIYKTLYRFKKKKERKEGEENR